MLKNITFSADADAIRRARERAEAEHTTLNDEFRRWLEKYASSPRDAAAFAELTARLGYVQPGRAFSREEMNER